MTLTKDITAKFAVAAVAVAMAFSAFAAPAQAQTTEELQQMINDLLAQVAQLQAQTGGTTGGSMSSDVCPYTWTRDLTIGSEGADVMKLQQFLNETPDLRVAPAGSPGSAGMETMYYGPATAAAVSKMQVMFRAEVLTPNGLVNPTGYFGASSRAKANDLCVTPTPAPTPDDGDEDGMEDEDEDEEDDGPMTLQGEGVLSVFEVDEEESEISEGMEDEVMAEITVEADDGDIELARMTVALSDATLGTPNQENDPWDVFDEFSVWVDGDKIASFDASDEDEYTDEDGDVYAFRFTDMDLFLEEDEEVTMLFAVSVANSVDGSDTSNEADWTFDVSEVRYFDADGVATTEDNFDDLDGRDSADLTNSDTQGQFSFDIEEAGTDDRADIESSSDDPDATTLKVEDDNNDSEDYTVFVFDIEVDRDSSDLEVGDTLLDVVISNASTTQSYDVDDVIAEIVMMIDGEVVEGDEVTQTAVAAGVSTTTFEFEYDQDVVLEGDEDYEVSVMISFVGTDDGDNYAPGTTVQVFVDGQEWEVEGVENDDELVGTENSELHTLNTVVPVITNVSVSESTNDTQTSGSVSFKFTVEADGEDDIENFTVADIIDSVSGGADTATATLSRTGGDAEVNGAGDFTILDGDDATFALTYTFDDGINGTYFVNVDRILGIEIDETSDALTITGN